MSSRTFGSFLEVEPPSKGTTSVSSRPQDGPKTSRSGDHELDEFPRRNSSTVRRGSSHISRHSTIENSADPERSNPATPPPNEAVDVVPSLTSSPMNKWRLLSACLINLGGGLNDSAPGALIPYMEKEYGIGYAVVSLIFITNALGYIIAAGCVHAMEARLGRARTYALAISMLVASYAIIICKPPFPVIVMAFLLIGFGLAVPLSLNNVFCANLVQSTAALGALHGAYGIGGTVSPLIATAIASRSVHWPFFYFAPLGLVLFNIGFSFWSFRNFEDDLSAQPRTTVNGAVSHSEDTATEGSRKKILKRAVKDRTTLLGAVFIFAYQGAEVSISGWVLSFLVSHRGADVGELGYVTSGFWGGITLGRFLLSHPAQKLGKKLSVILLVLGSAAFQLLVWLVPNVIGNAVALAILGVLLGPIYPCAASVFSTLLPRNIQVSSLGFVSAMGSSGGAFAPFFTGLLAQNVGTMVLHPICIGLYAVMIAAWTGLPKIRKKSK